MTDAYCTDCEQLTTLGPDGRGSCGHGRVIRVATDMISRAEDDRQTQKAVAAERQAVVEECLALIPALKDQEAWVANLFDRIRTSIIALAPDGVRTDTDMIPRAEAARQTQEAVAAALMEAESIVRPKLSPSGNGVVVAQLHRTADAIRALIAQENDQ